MSSDSVAAALRATLRQRKLQFDLDRLLERIQAFSVETPSWGYGNSGTRFKVFAQRGAARNLQEKLADAAMVHRLTRACPTVALHIPWDQTDDWLAARREAEKLGLRIGAINPNLFQDDAYKLGSLANPNQAIRRRAIEHVRECIGIAQATGSNIISLWLADGTNYPGQDDLRARRRRLIESLQTIYADLPPGMRLLIEYKFFEPAFYSTDLPDWGTSLLMATKLGPQAEVLVDTGHHPQGTNIPQVVAQLLDEERLGGFHFNDRKYGDDDLIVGSVNPFELFCIFNEIVAAAEDGGANVARVAYMIDQSHNIEPKIEAMVQSVVNIQIAYAKALLVDREALRRAQKAGDILAGYRALQAAYETDVRPLLEESRHRQGLDVDPVVALRKSGYVEQIERERSAELVSAGYPGS
jgi:L-rhamnose isomerase/sugar isomerase